MIDNKVSLDEKYSRIILVKIRFITNKSTKIFHNLINRRVLYTIIARETCLRSVYQWYNLEIRDTPLCFGYDGRLFTHAHMFLTKV